MELPDKIENHEDIEFPNETDEEFSDKINALISYLAEQERGLREKNTRKVENERVYNPVTGSYYTVDGKGDWQDEMEEDVKKQTSDKCCPCPEDPDDCKGECMCHHEEQNSDGEECNHYWMPYRWKYATSDTETHGNFERMLGGEYTAFICINCRGITHVN